MQNSILEIFDMHVFFFRFLFYREVLKFCLNQTFGSERTSHTFLMLTYSCLIESSITMVNSISLTLVMLPGIIRQ